MINLSDYPDVRSIMGVASSQDRAFDNVQYRYPHLPLEGLSASLLKKLSVEISSSYDEDIEDHVKLYTVSAGH